uniref:Uncharacterized protein n=2 Tax=Setaria italica TaxID=4555 RepID=K3YII1_SETIT
MTAHAQAGIGRSVGRSQDELGRGEWAWCRPPLARMAASSDRLLCLALAARGGRRKAGRGRHGPLAAPSACSPRRRPLGSARSSSRPHNTEQARGDGESRAAMAGTGCHSLLSPASRLSPEFFSRRRASAVGRGACRPSKVRPQIRCCAKDDDSKGCADMPKGKDEETRPSRRKCLVCLGAVTLISATGPTISTPNGLAADMMNKPGIQKAVCRNCNGSGAVIFPFSWSGFIFSWIQVICVVAQENGKPSTERGQKMFTNSQSARIATVEGSWYAQSVLELACRTTKAYSGDQKQSNCLIRCTTARYCQGHSVVGHTAKGFCFSHRVGITFETM